MFSPAPRRRSDLTVVIFPKQVANETCRVLFLREMLRCRDIVVLDARVSETVHFAERVLRRLVRSGGKLPWFGLRLSDRAYLGSFEFAPNFVDPRPLIGFTKEEQDAGLLLFEELGIPRGSRFICFNVRDSAYTSERYPTDPEKNASHDYRNPPIDSYVPSVKFLLECGYYVVHMGKVVIHPFPIEHPQFIPYAGSSLRSDFLDVFLYSQCVLAIQGSGSGIDTLASIFNKPLCTADVVPLWHHLYTPCNTGLRVVVPALLEDIAGNRVLTASETATMRYSQSQDYKSAGIRIIPNTPEEILAATQFALHAMSPNKLNNQPSSKWNEKFWQQYCASMSQHGFDEPPNVRACGRSLFIPEVFLEAHSSELFAENYQ
jgi:putative glycosyltransferase (TIGR04372 family)